MFRRESNPYMIYEGRSPRSKFDPSPSPLHTPPTSKKKCHTWAKLGGGGVMLCRVARNGREENSRI